MILSPQSEPIALELNEIKRVAPQLMPLWEVLQECGHLEPWREHHPPQEALKALKKAARDIGVTKAGWRYLCRLSEQQVRELVGRKRALLHEPNRVRCINLMARAGEAPASPVVFSRLIWLVLNAEPWDGRVKEALLSLVRAALREAQNWASRPLDFIQELSFVFDWFRFRYLEGEGLLTLDPNQRHAPWPWFLRCAEVWHRQGFKAPPRKKGVQWESLIGAFRLYGYDVVPLTSVEQLYDEGNEMEHCIITYENFCVVGKSRIFSIRDRGQWLATFELSLRYGEWRLIQVRGWRNGRPDPFVVVIARETLRRYREAWARQQQQSLPNSQDQHEAARRSSSER